MLNTIRNWVEKKIEPTLVYLLIPMLLTFLVISVFKFAGESRYRGGEIMGDCTPPRGMNEWVQMTSTINPSTGKLEMVCQRYIGNRPYGDIR